MQTETSSQERVIRLFETDVGRWPVARMHLHIGWKREQLALNSRNQLMVISTRKIGAANASVEERIAHNDLFAGHMIKTNATG